MSVNPVGIGAFRPVSFKSNANPAESAAPASRDEKSDAKNSNKLIKGSLITAAVALGAYGAYALATRGKKLRLAEEQRQLQQEIAEAIERDSRPTIKDDSVLKRIEEKFVPKAPEKMEHDAKQAQYNAMNWDLPPVSRELVKKMEREKTLPDEVLYLGRNFDAKLAELGKKGVVSKVENLENGYKSVTLTYPESSAIEKVVIKAQSVPDELKLFPDVRKYISVDMKNGNGYSIQVDGNDLHRSLMQMQGDVFASKYEIAHNYKRTDKLDFESYGTFRSDFIDDAIEQLETSMKQSGLGDEAAFAQVRDLLL